MLASSTFSSGGGGSAHCRVWMSRMASRADRAGSGNSSSLHVSLTVAIVEASGYGTDAQLEMVLWVVVWVQSSQRGSVLHHTCVKELTPHLIPESICDSIG